MTTEDMKELVRQYVEPWNTGNVEVLDALCAPGCTVRNLVTNETESYTTQKQTIIQSRSANPDFKITVEEILADGERAAFRWTMSWTEDGAPKKAVGITILRTLSGKVVEDSFVADYVKIDQPVTPQPGG